jgi:hypothetical protein
MARTNDTRARVRELAEELAANGQEPTPTVIMRLLGKGSPNTIVDELRKWREESTKSVSSQNTQAETRTSAPEENAQTSLSLLEHLIEPLARAIDGLSHRIEEQDKAHTAQMDLAYERFTAVQKMAMVAIDEAREQSRFWKQEAERAKLEAAVQADTYRDAMRSAQGEARRLAELLQLHQTGAGALRADALKIPPAPTMAGIGPAPSSAAAPATPREPMLTRQYDPDGHADE